MIEPNISVINMGVILLVWLLHNTNPDQSKRTNNSMMKQKYRSTSYDQITNDVNQMSIQRELVWVGITYVTTTLVIVT